MNSTIVLNRLTAARAEGGNAHAVTQAQALVGQYYPGRTFDVETTVNAVFNALDRFDAPGAETAINDALATLARPEPVAVAETTTVAVDGALEGRVRALENVARQNGIPLGAPAGADLEARVIALETAARNRGLL